MHQYIMDHKKSKVSVLGPRGRRRLGRDVSFKDPGIERKGYIGGQAEVQKDLKRKGFGVFPEGFLDSCNVDPKERTKAIFVLPKTGKRKKDVIEWEVAKLATLTKQDSPDSLAWDPPLNPFTQAMPFGDEQPLPRQVFTFSLCPIGSLF